MNFGTAEIDLAGGIEVFRELIEGFHRAYCPDTVFEPELTYPSNCDVFFEAEKIDGYLQSGWFRSIDIRNLMKQDAELVFSMSHPIVTAWDGAYDRYTRTETGERLYANLRNYCVEGWRKVDWVVNGYERYHRTVSSLINALIGTGLVIEECQEAHISDEMRKQYPALFGGTIHRPEFIFFRCRKSN